VGAILLIACANVGNLLLARAVTRERELSVRAALGAHRFRILRQLAIESLLLAGIGAALGLVLAEILLAGLLSLIPAELPAFISVGLDGRVLGFTLLVAIGTSFVFGLLPALQVSRLDLIEPLRDGGRVGSGVMRQRLKHGLVVLEMGLALVLLVATGLLIRSFVTLSRVNPGFEPSGLTAIQVNLTGERYREAASQTAYFRDALARLESLPWVERAAAISWLPLGTQGSATGYRVADKPDPPPEEPRVADVRMVQGDLFRTMGVPVVAGRGFDERDRADSRSVVIVNETLAREVWPGEDPIGKTVLMSWWDEMEAEVVGVVGDVRLVELATAPRATLYWPQTQVPNSFMTLVVRTRGGASSADLRAVLAEIDPEQPLSSIESMETVVARSLGRPRLTLTLMTLFGGLALLLAAVGVYGVVAFNVTQRVHEIGLRMALGAGRSDILKLVLRQGLALATAGVVLGVLGAVLASRLLESLLFGVTPRDPATLALVALFVLAITLAASYFPARRATRVDPFVALRTE
jgi:putative ABC transport system permease protein